VSQPEAETRAFYEDNVRRFGFDHRGLGFRTRSSQARRFEALLGLGAFDDRRLLDVGCGFGDLLAFLLERGIRPRYTGVDICAPMIDRCQERFAVREGIFAVADALEYQPAEPFDYVVASGVFGFDAPGARERVWPTLERLFHWARLGVAVNFLSKRSPKPVAGRLYVDPAEALEWGFSLTPAARIDHSYLPNDFTLFLFRTPSWLEETAGGPE
jgi:SAM-dependent methyltransferase